MKEVKNEFKYWKPTLINDEIQGKVLEMNKGQFGEQYVIEDKRLGKVQTPAHKVLQNRMKTIKVGDYVRIVLSSKELPKVKGHSETLIYTVYRDE